jgi:hypothetical protein
MFFNDLHENEEGRLNGRKKVAPSLTPSSVTPYQIDKIALVEVVPTPPWKALAKTLASRPLRVGKAHPSTRWKRIVEGQASCGLSAIWVFNYFGPPFDSVTP